jgi:hypothetical protein
LSYEQSLSERIDAAAEAAARGDGDLQAWRATKDRIRAVLQDVEQRVHAAEHSVGVTEGDDLIEITFRARTSPPDRSASTSFVRKGAGVLVTNLGPGKIPVGGGMQRHAELTDERIRQHVAASLGKALETN